MSRETARIRWTEAFFRESRKAKDSYLSLLCDDVRRQIEEYCYHLFVLTKDEVYRSYRGRTYGAFRVHVYKERIPQGYVEGVCEDGLVVGSCAFEVRDEGSYYASPTGKTTINDCTWITAAFVVQGIYGTTGLLFQSGTPSRVDLYFGDDCVGECLADGTRVKYAGEHIDMDLGEIHERAKRGEWIDLAETPGERPTRMSFKELDRLWNQKCYSPSEEIWSTPQCKSP